jgi:hypothetical protein
MFTHTHSATGFPARCKRCGGLLKEPVAFCIHCGIHHPLAAELASRTTQPVQPSLSATPSDKAAATLTRTSTRSTDTGTRAKAAPSVDAARSAGAGSSGDAVRFKDATDSSDAARANDVNDVERSGANPSFSDAGRSSDATHFNPAAATGSAGPFQEPVRSKSAFPFNVAVPPASAAPLFGRVAPSTDTAPYVLPTANIGVPELRRATMPHEFLEPHTTRRRALHAEGAVILVVLMLAFGVGWLWMSDRSETQSRDEGPARAVTGAVALNAPDRLMSMLADVGSGRLASEKRDTPDTQANANPPNAGIPSNAHDASADANADANTAVLTEPTNANAKDATPRVEHHVGVAGAALAAAHDSPHQQGAPAAALPAAADRSDARQPQGDAASLVSRRDAALVKARSCLKASMWDCVRASSAEALAIDANNAEAQALMQQAIVASGWAPLSSQARHGAASPPAVATRPSKPEAQTRRTHRHAVNEANDGRVAGGEDDTRAIVEMGWKRAPAAGASAPARDAPSR